MVIGGLIFVNAKAQQPNISFANQCFEVPARAQWRCIYNEPKAWGGVGYGPSESFDEALARCVATGAMRMLRAEEPYAVTPSACPGRDITLSWELPTQNEDCSLVTDLAGVKVYVDGVEMLDIPDLVTATTLENVVGTHSYNVTVYDISGNESKVSSPVISVH